MEPESTKEIERKLAQERSAGQYDSTSEFTVNVSAALAKLANFQFPEPHYWVGKFVQAANVKEASSIHFEFTTERVEIVIEGASFPEAGTILQSATSAQTTRDHLITGLIALVGVEEHSVCLRVNTPTRASEATMGEPFDAKQKRKPQRGLTILLLDRKKKGRRSRRKAEKAFLTERCWVSGVPVYLNGESVPLRYSRGASRSAFGVGEQISLVCAPFPLLEGLPEFRGPVPSTEGRQTLDEGQPLGLQWSVHGETLVPIGCHFLLGTSSRPRGGMLNVSLGCKDATVIPVCDGVLLESEKLSQRSPKLSHFLTQTAGVGFQAYVAVSHTDTDLGHFRLRDNENWLRRSVSTLEPYLMRIWSEFLDCPKGFRTVFVSRKVQRFYENFMAFFMGIGGAALGGGTGGFLGGVAAAISSAYLAGNSAVLYTHLLSGLSGTVGGLIRLSGFAQSLQYLGTQAQGPLPYEISPTEASFLTGWGEWPATPAAENGEWATTLFEFARSRGGSFNFNSDGLRAEATWTEHEDEPPSIVTLLQTDSRLQSGLGNLRELPLDSLVLKRTIDGLSETLRWSEESHTLSQSQTDQETGWSLSIEVRASSEEVFAAAIFCLQEYCSLAVDPPSVQGLVVEPRLEAPALGKRSRMVWPYGQLPLLLARQDLPAGEEKPLRSLPRRSHHPCRQTDWGWHLEPGFTLPETFLCVAESSLECGGLLLLHAHHRSNSAVEFVREGVTGEIQPLFHPQDFFMARKRHPDFWTVGGGEKFQLSLRCIVPVPYSEWTPSGRLPQRRERALRFLDQHREDILALARLTLEHFDSLRFKLSRSQVLSRMGYLKTATLFTRENARRKKLRKMLEEFPADFDAMVGELRKAGWK